MRKETAENGNWQNEVMSQLNYTDIKLFSDWKKIHGKKQNKVAAKCQLLTFLFQKSKGETRLVANLQLIQIFLSQRGKI